MATFFAKDVQVKFSVENFISKLVAVNERSMKLEWLRYEKSFIINNLKFVTNQINSFLTQRAAIESEINVLSKKSQTHIPFLLRLLNQLHVSKLHAIKFIDGAKHDKKCLMFINQLMLEILSPRNNENHTDDLRVKLERIIARLQSIKETILDESLKLAIEQQIAKIQILIVQHPQQKNDFENWKQQCLAWIKRYCSELSRSSTLLIQAIAQEQVILNRIDGCLLHTYCQLDEHNAMQKILSGKLLQNQYHVDAWFKQLLHLFQDKARLDTKIDEVKSKQIEDRESIRKYKTNPNAFIEMNQLVTIQDILVSSSSAAKLTRQQLIEKLVQIISIVEGHHAHLMNGEKLKKGCENHITRLITSEFSFYTKKPLTTKEYKKLLVEIKSLVEGLPPNIQLILSSFAVFDRKGRQANVVLHVCSGNQVTIHQGIKANMATNDPSFGYPQLSLACWDVGGYSSYLQQVDTSWNGEFKLGNLVRCKTQGGAHFYTSIEICLDARLRYGESSLHMALQADIANRRSFPLQHNHVISSHWINPVSISPNIPKLIQADKLFNGRWFLRPGGGVQASLSTQILDILELPDGNYASVFFCPSEPIGIVNGKYREQAIKLLRESGSPNARGLKYTYDTSK